MHYFILILSFNDHNFHTRTLSKRIFSIVQDIYENAGRQSKLFMVMSLTLSMA